MEKNITIIRTAMIVLGVTFSVIIAETVLILIDYPKIESPRRNVFTGEIQFRNVNNEYLIHRLSPNTKYINVYSSNPRGYFNYNNAVEIDANSDGFRGVDFPHNAKQDQILIAFLGDSFTLGEGVWFEDTYPEQTARAVGEITGKAVAAYNFGMFAYNSTQEYLVLLEDVLPLNPDMVVVGYFINDAAGPYFFYDQKNQVIREDLDNPFFKYNIPVEGAYKLRVLQIFSQLYSNYKAKKATLTYYNDLYTQENQHWQNNKNHLQLIIKECQSRKIPIVIICFPVLYDLDNYCLKNIHETIKNVVYEVADESTFYVDMLPVFAKFNAKELWVHSTDQHPNEYAHKIIAGKLAPIILDQLKRR